MLNPITQWFRYDSNSGRYIHNHIESEHSELDRPEPKSSDQKSWINSKWIKRLAHLDENNKIIYVES